MLSPEVFLVQAGPPFLSVVIMAFNEREGLRPTVEATVKVVSGIESGQGFEILIVDDGSTDGTGDLADALAAADPRLRVFHHQKNQGLGAVYRLGFEQTRGDWVTFLPADGEVAPDTLLAFLPHTKNADLILGSLPDAERSPGARLLSFAERVLIRAVFGRFPRFQGGMLFGRRLLENVPVAMPAGRGWMIVTELILRAERAGFRIVSVPTALSPRHGGASKVRNLKSIAANLKQLAELRLMLWNLRGEARPLRSK